MELQTIEMDAELARKKHLEYRNLVKGDRTAEDEAMRVAYREAARGARLIRLSETIRAGGTQVVEVDGAHYHVPNLAAIRADAKWCYTRGITSRGKLTLTARQRRELAPNNKRDKVIVRGFTERGTRPDPENRSRLLYVDDAWHEIMAMVPTIPPLLRPKSKLDKFLILWEVESWSKAPLPPGDPALLRPVGGDLYAVVAVWDLTELERAVLAEREVPR